MSAGTSSLADARILPVDSSWFLGVPAPRHVVRSMAIALTEHCFLPRLDDLQADWVASVAVPAFRLIAAARGPDQRRAFCSIGSGSGLDALAAAEILEATRIGVTDVHEDVVWAARHNIQANLVPGRDVEILSGTGDLLSPLQDHRARFDVIYENLPNVPLARDADMEQERVSSGFFPPRPEPIPDSVRDSLLSLHYVALLQARDFLAPGGVVLSMLGGRVPLQGILDMARQAGYRGDFLTYGWKIQAQAEGIVDGYADWQRHGLGPFHFYRFDDLERVFAGIDPVTAASRALDIERALLPFSIDAADAADVVARGEKIGHTYVVLASTLDEAAP